MIDWISVLLGMTLWVLLMLTLVFRPSRLAEQEGEAAQPATRAQRDGPRRGAFADSLGALSQRALLARGRRGKASSKARLVAKSRTSVARSRSKAG